MPRKKKTRKQKIISDTRHIDYAKFISPPQISTPTPIQSGQVSGSLNVFKPQQSTGQFITTSQYSYLYSDLLKTCVLTFSIIIAEIVFGFLFFGAK